MPVGVVSRPAVTAKLRRTSVQAMGPIGSEQQSEAKMHEGVFAWGADNRAVRLYPTEAQRELTMEVGEVRLDPADNQNLVRLIRQSR